VTVNADTWTVTGITSDADLKLRVGTEIAGPDVPANLVINQAINLGTGSLYLDVDGNVTQTAPGTITADGLALIVDGYTELDLNNDVNLLAAQPEVAPGDDPNGAILFNDIDDLAIDTVSVTVNADTWTVTGITSDADMKLRVGTEIAGPDVLANLVINQAINLGTGSLYLDVDGNVTQTAPGTITADGLALIVDGYTELDLNNDVNLLAAQPEVAPGDDPNGAILFNDIDDLAIDTVSVTVNADTWTVTGITSDADMKLRVGTEIAGPDVLANLVINQAINLGTGSLYLDVDGNVTQTAPGTITADGLALIVDGYTRTEPEQRRQLAGRPTGGRPGRRS
jgi:ribosomal protein L24E